MRFPVVMEDNTPHLELSRAVDGGHRVDASKVFFPAYKRQGGWAWWSPMVHNHGMLFFNTDEKLMDLVSRFNRRIYGDKYATIHIVDDSQVVAPKNLEAMSRMRISQTHDGEDAVLNAINELFSAYEDMKHTCHENGLLNPPNRRYDIVFLVLSDDHFKTILRDRTMFTKMVTMMIYGADFNIPIFVCSPHFSGLWKDLVDASDWCLFVGENNERMATQLLGYSVATRNNRFQEEGLLLADEFDDMIPVYSAQLELSREFSEQKKIEEKRQKDYESLLRSLTNGD